MSHDPTPMNGIIGMTELTLDTSHAQRISGHGEELSDMLLQLINHILDSPRSAGHRARPRPLRGTLSTTA
jgi:hypothetical protein